jgi:cephalosporin hydroxylase
LDNHRALIRYGKECQVIRELGVAQGGTLAALLRTRPKKLTGIDIASNRFMPYMKYFTTYADRHGIEFEFIERNSLDESSAAPCDLLHIDSRHTHDHLFEELRLHGPLVKKYIVCHDTNNAGLLMAIAKYITLGNPGWQIIEHHSKNVGFTVLKRLA